MSGSLGIVVDDRFDVRRQVGEGAMGVVYEGWDREAEERVAIKIMRATTAQAARRFVREGAILAELQQAAIVRYVTHGTSPAGESYLVMEWLEGRTLEDRLKAQPLSIADTLLLANRMIEGLTVAHQRGVIHRDLKPSNVFLAGDDLAAAKILDFGIARRAWDEERLTQTGAIIGTPLYMPPEQARGHGELDARADVYSLGAVLFECMAGRPVFLGNSPIALLSKICQEEPPSLAKMLGQVPPELDELLRSMLAKDPAQRPRNMLDVAARITVILGTAPRSVIAATPKATLTTGAQRVMSIVLMTRSSVSSSPVDVTTTLPLAGEGDPEIETIKEIAARFDGRVDHLIDGSTAITFLGSANPTDLLSTTARCALSLRSSLPDAAIAVSAGRGIIYGRVPVGDAVERAAALLDETEIGTIRLDPTVAATIEGTFEIDPNGALLVRERELVERARLVLGKSVPCLGRERELTLLEGIFSAVVDNGEAYSVLLTGAAGVGKTRLRQELVKRLQQQGRQFELLLGRTDPIRSGSAFALLAPSLRWTAGVTGDDSPDARRQKLRARMAGRVAPEHVQRVSEFLGEIAAIPFPDEASPALRAARNDPRLMGDQMRSAWVDWIGAECSTRPVLLVLEDFQWADPPSVQLVEAALRAWLERPFMVLAVARPEVTERFPRLWQDCGVQALPLPPLSRKASEKLARAVVGDATPSELLTRLVEQADGNPLFLEELLRGDAVNRTRLPETVLAIVQARLDALGGESARVLRAASVFGETFTLQGVLALVGELGERSVEESLASLIEREVVVPRAQSGAAEYAFRNALVRDASYAMLTESDRALGHRLAAEWLEINGEHDPVVLAEHFERGADRPRAATWYARAAEQALRADDLPAALARVERAAACGATGATLGEIGLIESQARYWRGELTAAETSARRAVHFAREASAAWFDGVRELIEPLAEQGRVDDISSWAGAVDASEPLTPQAAEAKIACLSWCAGALSSNGRRPVAAALLERAGAILADLPARETWVTLRFHYARGVHLASGGSPTLAIAEFENALEAARQAGDTRTTCAIRGEIGGSWCEAGEPERAAAILNEVIAEARQRSLVTPEMFMLPDLAIALIAMGRVDEARDALLRSLSLAEEHRSTWTAALAHYVLATAALVAGDYDESERRARAATECGVANSAIRAASLAALARALLAKGRVRDASQAAEEALSLLESLGGARYGESLIRLMSAETRMANADSSGARVAIAAARERLLARANEIADRDLRERFLSRIADNVKTLELAKAWTCAK